MAAGRSRGRANNELPWVWREKMKRWGEKLNEGGTLPI